MREQGSEAWQRGKREATGAAKRGREKDGKYRRDQERPREGRRKGKQDRKREHDRERESKRDSEIGGGSEARRGEATAGKSRYVRVTSYTRYTCVQRKARVSARVMYVRVDVRMCVCARARDACVNTCVCVCTRCVVTSGRGSKRQRSKRGPWGGGRRVAGGGDGWQSVGRRVG